MYYSRHIYTRLYRLHIDTRLTLTVPATNMAEARRLITLSAR